VNTEQQSGANPSHSKDWPHAPIHRLSETGVFMVTAGTYRKEHCFKGDDRLDLLESSLLRLAKQYGWQLEAWAVFSNHYHFVAQSPSNPQTLQKLLRHLHADTARSVNKFDGTPSRKVWHNFWDARLTFERSYLARLNYVHQNPVHHKLVAMANQYRWCSAAWFERTCTPSTVKMLYSFKSDQLKVPDDF
jgi:REP-associated tyrosine transposase